MGLFSSKKSKNKYVTLTTKSKLTVDIVDDNKWKKCNRCNEIIYNDLATEILSSCVEQGYLTISNALQWRLQYGRVIQLDNKIEGITNYVWKY